MTIAKDFQPPKSLKRGKIVVRRVVPCCPCVPAIVGGEIFDPSPPASPGKCLLDLAPCTVIFATLWPLVGLAIRTPEHFTRAKGQLGERLDDERVQRHPTVLTILGVEKSGMGTVKVDFVPIQP